MLCVVYVYYCIFWARSQSEIDNVMKFSRRMSPVTTISNPKISKYLSSWEDDLNIKDIKSGTGGGI